LNFLNLFFNYRVLFPHVVNFVPCFRTNSVQEHCSDLGFIWIETTCMSQFACWQVFRRWKSWRHWRVVFKMSKFSWSSYCLAGIDVMDSVWSILLLQCVEAVIWLLEKACGLQKYCWKSKDFLADHHLQLTQLTWSMTVEAGCTNIIQVTSIVIIV